jgi:hypothetical protein
MRAMVRMLRTRDFWLLGASAAFGVASAARATGTGGLALPAALLGAAALLAFGPLVRLAKRWNASGARGRGLVGAFIACHVIATLYFFPPEDILNDRPVLTLDHAVHFYEVERGKDVFWNSFRLDAYDPFFLAGYPGGVVFEIDTVGVGLWCALLRFIDTARSFKLFILLAHLLAAVTIYAGCRRLRFDPEESAFGALAFLAYWQWGRPYAGDFRYAGMFAYLFVCHLSLYIAGLFESFLGGERVVRFYVLGALAFLIHPTAAVLLPVPFVALYLAERRRRPRREGGRGAGKPIAVKFAGWCLVVLVVNAFWLVPFFRYLHIKTASESFFQIDGIRGLLTLLIKPGNFPALALLVLAAIGCGTLARRGRGAEAVAPAASSIFLLFIAGFGTRLPLIDQMEPGRFIVPAFVFMAPLAGAGVRCIVEIARMSRAMPRVFRRARSAVALLLLACIPVFGLVESRAFYRHTLSTTMTSEVTRAIEAVRANADRSGRLMIEDGPAWAYGDSHLPSMFPLFTGIEQIGGPYPFMFIEHAFATFQNRMTMGMPLREMRADTLLGYIDLYNIRWILTATPESASYIRDLPYAKPLWASEPFALYGVAAPYSGFAFEPGVMVRSSYDSLRVSVAVRAGLDPPKSLILKYHWDKGLRVSPPCRISPVKRLRDPVPFILLDLEGQREATITFR